MKLSRIFEIVACIVTELEQILDPSIVNWRVYAGALHLEGHDPRIGRFQYEIPFSVVDACWNDETEVFDITPLDDLFTQLFNVELEKKKESAKVRERITYERLNQKFGPPTHES